MKCLILAAGYATRLYPLTENFPKPLLKVGEKSILDWLVDDLVDTTDIDEFVVISNHKFAQHFEDWKSNKQKTRPYEITVILYASRCNNFHGNVAARMNSINANKDTFKMYTDMFLAEYIILAIHLNSQGALSDVVLNKVKKNANLMV